MFLSKIGCPVNLKKNESRKAYKTKKRHVNVSFFVSNRIAFDGNKKII